MRSIRESEEIDQWSCALPSLVHTSQLSMATTENRYEALGMVDKAHNETEEEELMQALSPRSDRPTPCIKSYIKTSTEKKQRQVMVIVRDEVVESLWVRIRGMENKADVTVGVYYRSPSQDDSTNELFYRQLGEISGSVALVLMGDFNFLDINWEYHSAVTSKSGKFLKFVEDNFLTQVLSEPTRKNALLDLLFVNREGLVGDVMEAKEIVQSLEARSGFSGRLQSCGSYMKGEDTKGQSSTRVETGQCCVRQQERIFFKYVNSKRRSKENIGLILVEDGHLNNRDEEKAEAFNAFYCLR
ncbi:hypothetical protein QYF61_004275 [Mycteria americana]|uniref:Endonuclease/exonuclease/phosphatase domain-containing protein n=1 Tax=Mycteria americana TaxID=33587 RepID=A0AAN7MNN4_MYCAM|nr:hypothetical protein QYF61_004275 [Mycteria americana]